MDRQIINYTKDIIKKNSEDFDFEGLETEEFYSLVERKIFSILEIFDKKILVNEFANYFKVALNEFRHENPIKVGLSQSLVKQQSNWLTKERQELAGWCNNEQPLGSYRTRYLEYLKKIGRPSQVVDEVAKSSLSILGKIADPLANHDFLKKGLVVGSVQSGKTGNFNAIINSCIDLGYRLIIVLSGGMEDLRRQSQERIQKEVEGREIKQGEWNGVGNVAKFGVGYINKEQIVMPTSIEKDFNLGLSQADFALDKINVLVVKKNISILNNILVWLKKFASAETIDRIPLLIIDDEADNASLNNLGHKGQQYASSINLQIRCILSLFSKSSYIGYTATPFANILQDRNAKPDKPYIAKTKKDGQYEIYPIGNLFPEDFIELLMPPSNYIGPKNFFETRINEVKKIPTLLTVVNDWQSEFPYRVWRNNPSEVYINNFENLVNELGSEKSAKKQFNLESRAATKYDNFPKKLPESLKDAVKCFIISCAVRLKRKQYMKDSVFFQRHNSMLIHISRFTNWQDKTTELLNKYFEKLQEDLNNAPINSEIYNDFRRVWNKYYLDSIENGIIKDYLPQDYYDDFLIPMDFDEVLKYLINAVNGIEIVCANSNSNFNLDYSKEPKKYIVIGGNRLSRGFTLEGLTINYFVRDTNYADSLLQMGRWFGYRPGYLDCCKLFTTIDTIESFDFATSVVEDIEAQFQLMASKNKTPADFAIKVMNDPDVIKITRPAILKNASSIRWSYSNKLDQTTKFVLDKSRIENFWKSFVNYFSTKTFLDYGKSGKPTIKYYETDWKEVCTILSMQNTFINPDHFNPLIAFIKDVVKNNYLIKWHVGIKITGQGKTCLRDVEKLKFQIKPAVRNVNQRVIDEIKASNKFTASGNSSNIITSGTDFAFALSEEEKLEAERIFRENNNDKTTYPEKIYRQRLPRTNGILLIYPIDMESIINHNQLIEYFKEKNITGEIPLLGFAVGISDLGDGFEKEYFVQKGFLDEHGNIISDFEINEIDDEDYSDELIGFENE